MIHSLSGGTIQDVGYYNFAKVQLDTGEIMYYIYNIPLTIGQHVLVPVGKANTPTRATVLELRPNVSKRLAPFPVKHLKEIIRSCD